MSTSSSLLMPTMMLMKRIVPVLSVLLLLLSTTCGVYGRAILGIDLGSYYMKVALVQSGSPLEIVTNLHSKRKTEQMILFDGKANAIERFYGADAKSLYARKSITTPVGMSTWLGKDDTHPTIQSLIARHSSSPIKPVYDEERAGLVAEIGKASEENADSNKYTPEELVAMVLEHAKTISVAHASSQGNEISTPQDCVITVPSFSTIHERLAMIDAATLANLKVLTLIDENTASALQYAMDKTFLPENGQGEQMILFYNMGASSLQVSLIRFFSYEHPQKYGKSKSVPSLEVLAKTWDSTLGGNTWDDIIVNYLADTFNQAYKTARSKDYDIRTNVRAMTKLSIQANKVKQVLSANTEIPIYMEALYDDVNLSAQLTRTLLEELSNELLERAVKPVEEIFQQRENVTIANITAVELIGGGMRVPSIQKAISEKLSALAKDAGSKVDKKAIDLGMHLNSDESMALGAAFGGANISTAFRVRQVGLTDINPFGIQVTLSNHISENDEKSGGGLSSFFGGGGGSKKTEGGSGDDEEEAAAKEWTKKTTVFKSFGKLGVKKTIAFTHDRDVHCALNYLDDDNDDESMLPKGTEKSLERYNITGVTEFANDMKEKGLGKPKVSLQFELNAAGLTSLIKAEAAVEETYTVQEEVEIDDDDEEETTDGDDATNNDTTSTDETTTTTTDEKTSESTTEDGGEKESDTTTTTDESSTADDANATTEDSDSSSSSKEPEKKPKKTKLVEKEKKKTHKMPLKVEVYYTGRVRPHTTELLTKSSDKLTELAARDAERVMLEETRNKLESYIFQIKNKLVDDADDIEKVSTSEQRELVEKLALDTETWMDEEGYKADLVTTEEKYVELSVPFEKIKLRIAENTARPKAIEALQKKLNEIDSLMSKWEKDMPQITEDERTEVTEKTDEIRGWILEKEQEQASKALHEEPAFLSNDVPMQLKDLEKKILKLSKRPKPKPQKKEKKTKNNETTTTTTTDDDDNSTTTTTTSEGEETTKDGEETTDDTGKDEDEKEKEETDNESSKTTKDDDDETSTGPGDGEEL